MRDVNFGAGIFEYNSMMVTQPAASLEARVDSSRPERERVGVVVLGAVVTAAVTLIFFSFYWNRFIGLRSGSGAFYTGSAMLSGLYPYRDYFLVATPLNIVKSWLELGLFGDRLVVLRACDVLERTGLGLLMYFWLVRLFSARNAAVAALVTIVVSACDYSDMVSSYNHDAVLWAVGSGFAATFVLGRRLSARSFAIAAIISGLLAALSLDTKQTIGLGATVAIPFVVSLSLARLEGGKRAWQFLGLFTAGWSAAVGALVLWLLNMHILPDFLREVFVTGPSAKAGSPMDFVTRTAIVTGYAWWAAIPALIVLAFTIRQILRATGDAGAAEADGGEKRNLLLVLGAGTAALVLGVAAAYAGVHRIPVNRMTIFFSLYATVILLVHFLRLYLRRGLDRREAQACLLAAVSFACAFMLSLSWPALLTMTVPALAFPVAALLQQLHGWRQGLVYLSCAGLVGAATLQKVNDPFDFDDFYDPPARMASAASTLPELSGMRLPASTVKLVDGTVRIVREHSVAGDTIFTYPEFGIFYALTHRGYPTLSGSHNIDVINDAFALGEAKRLLAAPPAVIIYSKPDEFDLLGDEKFWRHGKRSGQRDIIAAIEELIQGYHLEATFEAPPNNTPVRVYTLK